MAARILHVIVFIKENDPALRVSYRFWVGGGGNMVVAVCESMLMHV